MATTQYIGARYVPLFAEPLDWNSDTVYEALTIVYYAGNSYTSRQAVPKGIDITNEKYWALTGNYNAQIEAYRKEVAAMDGRVTENAQKIADEVSRAVAQEAAIKSLVEAEAARAKVAENKRIAFFDTVADMKKADLEVGMFVETKGFYEVGDNGGGYYTIVNDGEANEMDVISCNGNLYASLLVTDNVNVMQYGADKTGAVDATERIQKALDSKAETIYVSAGNFLLKSPIYIPFNKHLIGSTVKNSVFILNNTDSSQFMINVGREYDYNQWHTKIECITFTSSGYNNNCIFIYSGVEIVDVRISSCGCALKQYNDYIDMIRLVRTYIAYCNPTDNLYDVYLAGNSDSVIFDNCKIENRTNDNVLYITKARCFNLINSIINTNLTVNDCCGSIVGCHNENSNAEHEKQFSFNESNIVIEASYKRKNSKKADIVCTGTRLNNTKLSINGLSLVYFLGEYGEYVAVPADTFNLDSYSFVKLLSIKPMFNLYGLTGNTNYFTFGIGNIFSTIEAYTGESITSENRTFQNKNAISGTFYDITNTGVDCQYSKITKVTAYLTPTLNEGFYYGTTTRTYTDVSNAIFISIPPAYNNSFMQLYVEFENGTIKKAIIPIVNCQSIFIDGIAVNGYELQTVDSLPDFTTWSKVLKAQSRGSIFEYYSETTTTPTYNAPKGTLYTNKTNSWVCTDTSVWTKIY